MVHSVLLLLAAVWPTTLKAHVALTFPPARKYDLDFLDTFRTGTPCGGMAKNKSATTLVAGSTVNVTWHLGYPHGGGYRLELLDPSGMLLRNLTLDYVTSAGTEAQSMAVTLMASECMGCTLRLLRQATDWGLKYRFQSCADVDIVQKESFVNDCSGRGSASGSGCACAKPRFFGDRCQYENDCDQDTDCNGHGRCIDLGGTALPLKQCFCQPGFMGLTCEKTSSLSALAFNASLYQNLSSSGVDFFWRFVNSDQEVEGVIVGKKTTSWLAIGWRPLSSTLTCTKFPPDAGAYKAADFSAMDCNDIVLGAANGNLARVGDYYTRDRSTPRRDPFWGGTSDLTGAVAWETDSTTTIMFRKTRLGSGPGDHPFDGDLHVVWAFGQANKPFYKTDELKYHGPNRGQFDIRLCSDGRLCGVATDGAAAAAAQNLSLPEGVFVASIVVMVLVFACQALQNCCQHKQPGACK